MPNYDFRILLETVEGKKTSYYSSSFVDTSDGVVLISSAVYNRITGSVSASYQNQTIFSGSDVNSNFTFKDNTLLSASLQGSTSSGSIVFTALDTEYDRLLRYKFIGEKVTNTLGLPSDQWIYVDQVRLPADDEANIFQGNSNLGNVNISDTLTFAGGSDINSDIPILIDTGSDRYIKFVDERGISKVALRMGYDADADVYEMSGSDSFTFNIGGVNSFTSSVVNASHLTSSNFILRKNVDGGNASIIIENSNIDNGTDKGAGIEFKHHNNALSSIQEAGKIIAGKDNTYVESLVGSKDSNLQFFTTLDGTDTEKLRIASSGKVGIGTQTPSKKLTVEGDISASGTIFSNAIEVTHFTSSFITSSTIVTEGSNIFGDAITDTQTFNGHITASGNITVTGDISASGDLFKSKFVQMTNSSSTIDSFNTGSFQTCKYVLQVTSASNIQASEMLVINHNATASNTEYAQINSGLNLVDFTTGVVGNSVLVNAAGSFISCSVKFVRTLI
tara:strand:+ start:707 stop:2221 length:1515 start_codon:yes stop_codon:yes gene_type:complete